MYKYACHCLSIYLNLSMDPSYLLARNLVDQLAAFGCSVTAKALTTLRDRG